MKRRSAQAAMGWMFAAAAAGCMTFAPVRADAPATQAGPAAATQAATQPAAIPDGMSGAAWAEMLEQLSSGSFKVRSAAQKQLDLLPTSTRDALNQFADGEDNPEIKARLRERVAAMDLDLAVDPPPMAFHVKNGTIQDVAAEMAKRTGLSVFGQQMGMQFGVIPGGNGRYTLDTPGMPFWKIVEALNAQGQFGMQHFGNNMQLIGGLSCRHLTVVKGLAILPFSLSVQATQSLQDVGAKPTPPMLILSYSAMMDPRVKVISMSAPVFDHVTDDLGNDLTPPPTSTDMMNPAVRLQRMRMGVIGPSYGMAQQMVELPLPEKPGKTIKVAHGSVDVTVQVGTTTVDVDQIDKQLPKVIKVGMRTLTITAVNATPTMLEVAATMDFPAPGPVPANFSVQPVQLLFTDANGQPFQTFISGGIRTSIAGHFTPPFKLHLTAATDTKRVTMPFELNDLPMPALPVVDRAGK
jgi:hypothetical protein